MPRVFVAEDDPSIRSLIVQVLRLEGHEVAEFADGGSVREALQSSQTPDLVVLDIMMPHVDGLALLSEIRSQSVTQALPVVLLTAKADDATTWAGWSSGCDYYMTKPFEPEELVAAVHRLTTEVRA